jgi:hypothetical protein
MPTLLLLVVVFLIVILVPAFAYPQNSKISQECLDYFNSHPPKDYGKQECFKIKNDLGCPLIWNYDISHCRRLGYCRYKKKSSCLVSIKLGSFCLFKDNGGGGGYCVNKFYTPSPTLSPTFKPTRNETVEYEYYE